CDLDLGFDTPVPRPEEQEELGETAVLPRGDLGHDPAVPMAQQRAVQRDRRARDRGRAAGHDGAERRLMNMDRIRPRDDGGGPGSPGAKGGAGGKSGRESAK
ncbi:hypothetical protein BTA51_29300, partial [Hahella sp. CCB-MM4]